MSSYGITADILEKIHLWNEKNYNPEIGRPLRSLIGYTYNSTTIYALLKIFLDTGSGSMALEDHLEIRKDRTNGIVVVPESPDNPAEIAAQTLGLMERLNSEVAQQSYSNQLLDEVKPGEISSDKWTDDYAYRNEAAKSGMSATILKNESVYLQGVYTFYHPEDIADEDNAFSSQRNISLIQNILADNHKLFRSEEWSGISIVADVNKVTDLKSIEKVKDLDSVEDALQELIQGLEKKGWIYKAEFSLDNLEVILLNNGFDYSYPVLLPGEGSIVEGTIKFDVNLSVRP